MKFKNFTFTTCVLTLLACPSIYAQKNIIKISPLSFSRQVSEYEHSINSKFSIGLSHLISTGFNSAVDNLGTEIAPYLRFYPIKNEVIMKGFYLQGKVHTYMSEKALLFNGGLVTGGGTFLTGYQFVILRRISLDCSLGIRNYKDFSPGATGKFYSTFETNFKICLRI